MLQDVVGGVADIGLGVNDQPRCPLGGEDVAAVQVRAQQNLVLRGAGQRPEQRDPGPRQPRIDPVAGTRGRLVLLELLRPDRAHLRERAERVGPVRLRPQLAQQPGHHQILFGLGQDLAQRAAGQAPLQQQRIR